MSEEKIQPNIDGLKNELLDAIKGSRLEEKNPFYSLEELATYFASRSYSGISRGGWDGVDNDSVRNRCYLISIVKALSSVSYSEVEFLVYGKQLVNLTGEIYDQQAHSACFALEVIPSLVKSGLAKTAGDLVKGAGIANNLRRGKDRGYFFPRLVRAIDAGEFSSLEQMSRYN